jgi:hypothetical protein
VGSLHLTKKKDWQPPGVEVTRSLTFQLVPFEASSDEPFKINEYVNFFLRYTT